MMSPVPTILGADPVVQALTVAATSTIVITPVQSHVARGVMSPPRHLGWPDLLDLVLDRRDGLEKAGNRLEIRLRHVLVAGQRSLNHLAHEAPGNVAVRPVARAQKRDDLLLGPIAQARALVGREIGGGL